jgi:gliding motility-associated-like protein
MKRLTLTALVNLAVLYSFAQVNCNTWLNLPSFPAKVDIGDLDIPGNTVTVEALINRTTPYSGGLLYAGDVVSKHVDPTDVNYLLRPNSAEITTTNGYFRTPDICEIDLNKTYHVALVYDGSTLKFYRDGFLMSQVAATGNMIQNNWHTQIGLYDGLTLNTNLIGYINEVRIWNVARSQAEIRQYMNASLPSPATQTGLLAYYTFDNLLNKQGNATWNGALEGSAAINATNPNCTFTPDSCKIALANFTAPDTVCVNTPVTINNTSSGATSYYWTFCTGNLNAPPVGANLGVLNGAITSPVYIDYVLENGNYYGFMTDNFTGRLFRLDFGASLLNTPSVVNLGTVSGVIPATVEGIQVVKNEGKWYAIIVGGDPVGSIASRIIKVEFGANITNASPTAVNWGNLGNLDYPHDLYVFNDNGGVWYGLTVNYNNNSITRFNFTNSFSNTPTAVNLGNLGTLNGPTGIHAINDNGNWYAFVTNAAGNTLSRLNFGNSLLNTPTGTNLGNIGGLFHTIWDIQIIKYCGELIGYAINANTSYNDIIKLNFSNITATPTAVSFGNIGNMNFPHCLSKIFRVGADLYTFTPNVSNQTVSRLQFAGCTNASIPNSTSANPGTVTYNTPGTYNINLTLDDGLPTQTAYCKQVVVLAPPAHTPTQAINICSGNNIKIGTGVKYAQYTWNTGAKTDSITVNTAGTYWVQTDRFGCSNRDSMIVSVLADPVVNLGADTAVCSFNNFVLNAGNAGATYLWQNNSTGQTFTVTSLGKYYVRVTNASNCVSSDTIYISQAVKAPADFHYKQDICNPLSVQFIGDGNNLTNPYWDFGDGNTTTGNTTVVHPYAAFGNYTVRFGIQSGSCKDTITKVIPINVTTANLILTPDTTICFNTTKQLRAQPALSFCWSPTTYLNNPSVQNPVTSTPRKMTYYYTAEVTGNNIITNGDFTNGNTGFTSKYNFANPNITEGQYFVGARPQAWNTLLGDCHDHTTGTGNMLMVNGSPIANEYVWSSTITVTPNTNYAFSAWLQNLNVNVMTSNPARLQFSINGIAIGNIFQSNINNCIWEQFYTVWNSGNNTTATISVVNQNTVVSGNDFALDDISFAPVFIQRDSVIISVDTPVVRTNNDTTICKTGQVQLQATGGTTWSWTPAAGLTNTTIANPIATPASSTNYIVTGTTVNGCSAKDTVAVNLFPIPTVISNHDMVTCPNTAVQLAANSAMVSYAWTPTATLNNPAIANPVATPAETTVYTVQVKDANQCSYSDTVHVQVRTIRLSAMVLNPELCRGESITLKAYGGHTYQWSPAGSLDDATKATPTATPDTSTVYSVYIAENNCNHDTTIQVPVIVNPSPLVTAEKLNDIDCTTHSTQLNATGSAGNAYVWLPTYGLDHPTMPNPVCTTDTTITYLVTGTNKYGCTTVDSVTVYVTATGKISFMVPNAFTPNGDGRNDCFGVKSWGGATIEEFSVFNRWGERVFTTNNATACWDGRFRGEQMPGGTYVYVIRAKTYCGPIKRTGTLVLVR